MATRHNDMEKARRRSKNRIEAVKKAKEQAAVMYGICGAPLPSGGRCTNPAGWGTDHLGRGRCYIHSAENYELAPNVADYIKLVADPELHDLAEQALGIDPTNMRPEIAVLRAILMQQINSGDLKEAIRTASTLERLVATMARIENMKSQFVHARIVGALIRRIVQVVTKTVPADLRPQVINEIRRAVMDASPELVGTLAEDDKQ